MYDIVALGESLIDFTPAGINEMGMPLFSQNPGGAPANVLAMASKLGRSTAFVGKVGRDAFGRFLQEHMEKAGIDCSALRRDDRVPTTLAFVQLDEYGDRSFSFYRDPGADVMLRPEEVDDTLLEGCRIFHFGSVSLTKEPCRAAGALISYDPNYRPFLWPSVEAARRALCAALELTDILKVSEEEMCLLTGESTLPGGAEKLQAMGPFAVFITRGKEGAYFRAPSGEGALPAFPVNAVDTTGAGDAFWGALLAQIPGRGRTALEALTLTTTAKGAIPAMPDSAAIQVCVQAMGRCAFDA